MNTVNENKHASAYSLRDVLRYLRLLHEDLQDRRGYVLALPTARELRPLIYIDSDKSYRVTTLGVAFASACGPGTEFATFPLPGWNHAANIVELLWRELQRFGDGEFASRAASGLKPMLQKLSGLFPPADTSTVESRRRIWAAWDVLYGARGVLRSVEDDLDLVALTTTLRSATKGKPPDSFSALQIREEFGRIEHLRLTIKWKYQRRDETSKHSPDQWSVVHNHAHIQIQDFSHCENGPDPVKAWIEPEIEGEHPYTWRYGSIADAGRSLLAQADLVTMSRWRVENAAGRSMEVWASSANCARTKACSELGGHRGWSDAQWERDLKVTRIE